MSDIVHCINLPHRIDRGKSAMLQADQQGFEIKFWDGVEDMPRARGILRAHQQIIKYAKENNLSEVTIMEDDCIFTAPDAYNYYLKQKPEEFDIYWGGIYAGQLDGNRIVNGISGMTLYTVADHFYDFILNLVSPDEIHPYKYNIDRALGNFAFEKKYYVCLPFIVYQMHGFSDNHQRMTRIDAYHNKWEFYGSRPPSPT